MDVETRQRVNIDRPLYDQEQLHDDLQYEKPKKDGKLASWTSCRPAKILLNTVPILKWLPHYKWRRDFAGDLTSGITVAIMHIPQGMAYSLLGNVPAIVGIYMAFFPVLIYSLLGTSKHNSMGTFAIICLMTGKVVVQYSDPQYYSRPSQNASLPIANSEQLYSPIEVATVVTFCAALVQLLMYVLRLGVVSVLLSETLVSGFTTGAAFQVFTSQMKDIFGLSIPNHQGLYVVIKTWISIFTQIAETNFAALIIAAITIVVTAINNEVIKPRVAKRCSFPIPIELIAVVIGTLVSHYCNLEIDYGIKVVGDIPSGLPYPKIPPLALIKNVALDSISIALVAYAMSLSMALIFAQKFSYEVDANQELLAQGAGNLFGSFFSCMPFTTSMSRSLIQQSVGGKTQLTSFVSCSLLVLILMWIGPLFEQLPKSVLAGVIVVALKGMMMQIKDVARFWKLRKIDACLWIITFLVVVFVGMDIGLIVGLVLSLATVVYMGFKPHTCLLGSVPHTDIYLDVTAYKMAAELADIKIYHFRGGLNFASRSTYKSELWRLTGINPQKELGARKKLAKFEDVEELTGSNVSIQNLNDRIERLRSKTTTDVKYIILDFSAVTYIDPSGITALKLIIEDFRRIDITISVAGCCGPVYEVMRKCDFLNDKSGTKIFPTVHDAVQYTTVLLQSFNTSIYNTINIISK